MFGNMTVLIYSLSGGVLSLFAMYLILKLPKSTISYTGVSIVGAIFHNAGQLSVAVLVLQNIKIYLLWPYLLLLAIPTGFFVGMVSSYLLKYLQKSNFNFKDNR